MLRQGTHGAMRHTFTNYKVHNALRRQRERVAVICASHRGTRRPLSDASLVRDVMHAGRATRGLHRECGTAQRDFPWSVIVGGPSEVTLERS